MRPLLANRPLWLRFGIALGGVLFLFILVAGSVSVTRQTSLIADLLIERGRGLARSIANYVIDPLLIRDLDTLGNLVEAQVRGGDVLAVQVIDADSKIVADAEWRANRVTPRFDRSPPAVPEHNLEERIEDVHRTGLFGSVLFISDTDPVIWRRIQRGGAHIGWVRLVIDAEPARALYQRVLLNTFWMALLIVTISVSGVYLMLRRPVAALQRAAQFAASLGTTRGAQTPGSDLSIEIRQLFDALNAASARLASQDKALAESRLFVDNLTENMSDGVYAVDADGHILFMNREAERLFGWTRAELQNRRITDLLQLEDAHGPVPDSALPRVRALATGGVVRDDFTITRKDGSRMAVALAAAPLEIEGVPRGVVVVFQDITQRKQAEDELRAARDAAAAANTAKTNFLAIVSHELRTPMNHIIGLAYLLRQAGLPAAQHERVSSLQASAQSLMAIINDLLEFAQMSDGSIMLHAAEFDLDAALLRVLDSARVTAEAKGLGLEHTIAPDVPRWLIGDSARLCQALSKFVDNAVKFTEHGSVHVGVARERTETGGLVLRFAVTDTGAGIDPADQALLFDSFRQIANPLTRSHGGLGLGLAIASQLARLMNGKVGVESKVGRGSTFWMTARFEPAVQHTGQDTLFVRAARSAPVVQALLGQTDTASATRALLAGPPAPQLPADPRALAAALATLQALVADNDFAAQQHFEEHVALFRAANPAACQELEAALRNFDFEGAQTPLARFAPMAAGAGTPTPVSGRAPDANPSASD